MRFGFKCSGVDDNLIDDAARQGYQERDTTFVIDSE
jgi:hypothetical protein